LKTQSSPDVQKIYIADMITGYGVAEAVRHYYETYGGDERKESHCKVLGM
jgi:hypothetical protein